MSRRFWATTAVVAMSVCVLLIGLGVIGGFVWLGLRAQGWLRPALLIFAAALLWMVVPRPQRAPVGAVDDADLDAGALRQLTDGVTDALSVPRVDHFLVGAHHTTHGVRAGWARKAYLTIGLPQWIALAPTERVALLAAEAARLATSTGPVAGLVACADGVLTQLIDLTRPSQRRGRVPAAADSSQAELGAYELADAIAKQDLVRGASDSVGNAGMAVIRRPLEWVQNGLRRLETRRVLAVLPPLDARIRRLAGDALDSMLLSTLAPPRGLFAAAREARSAPTRTDPLAALDELEPVPAAQLQSRWEKAKRERATSHDGFVARRLTHLAEESAVGTGSGPPSGATPAAAWPSARGPVAAAANEELDALRPRVRTAYRQMLLSGSLDS